jgi:hypothetical protein
MKKLERIHAEIGFHLDEIRQLFKDPKITIIIRNPMLNDADVLLTDDDLEKVIGAIKYLQEKATHVLQPTGNYANKGNA